MRSGVRNASLAGAAGAVLLLVGCASGSSGEVLDRLPTGADPGCQRQSADRVPQVDADVLDAELVHGWMRERGAELHGAFTVHFHGDPERRWVQPIGGDLDTEGMAEWAEVLAGAIEFPDPPVAIPGPGPGRERPSADELERGPSDYFRLELRGGSELRVDVYPTVHCRPLPVNRQQIFREVNRLASQGLVPRRTFFLEVHVSESGTPSEVRVLDENDQEVRDNNLQALGERMRFEPARIDVVAVPVWTRVPLAF